VLGAVVLLGIAVVALTGEDEAADGDEGATASVKHPQDELAPGPLVTHIRKRSPVGRFEAAECRLRPHRAADPENWFHPRERFYPPRGSVPTRADLDHLASRDFAVIVTYRPNAPRDARDALERWAAEGIGVVVAPGRTNHAPPLVAYTFDRRLTCDGVDLDQLTEFTDRHFSRPLDYEPHASRSG
jgi:hypothetical protein